VRRGAKTYRIDLCYPEQQIAIEFDSWKHHSGRSAFDHDRARGNDLVLLGFHLLRFTSRSGDQQIVDSVAAALTRASVS
jgi:very-short-patch-repair endonuclease